MQEYHTQHATIGAKKYAARVPIGKCNAEA